MALELIDTSSAANDEQASAIYPGRAFDGVIGDGNATGSWYAYWSGAYRSTGYVGLIFPSAQTVHRVRLYLSGATYDPRNWSLLGSNDGSSWTTLLTVTDQEHAAKGWYIHDLTTTGAYTHYRLSVTQNWGNATYLVIREIELYNSSTVLVEAALVGQYSLVMEQALIGRYGDAATPTAALVGRYGDAAHIQAALVGRNGDMVPVLAALDGRYHLMHSVLAGLEGQYAICGSSVLAALEGRYDLRQRDEIIAALTGYYSLVAEATVQQIACPVRIGGVAVKWAGVSWTISEASYLIEATITLRDVAEFNAIAKMDTVEIVWGTTTYTLFVAAKLRARSISGDVSAPDYGADYTIIARSLTAGLDAPHALPVTMSWPATTLASAIAADLIAALPELLTLDFRLEDWLQPGGTFFLSDESPLEGLRKLAAIPGGILQTSPNNAIILRMADVVPPAQWDTVVPTWTIEDSGLFSDSESEEESNRYNVVTVTNQGESTRSTWFEVTDIDDYRKEVRGYRVPWEDFDLGSSGGDWVTIEDMGVIEEQVTGKVVDFVDGSATAPLPVYSMVAVEWLQAQLGAITAAEDKSLTSEVPGCSLAKISYTSKCHLWVGRSDRHEDVLFYEVNK